MMVAGSLVVALLEAEPLAISYLCSLPDDNGSGISISKTLSCRCMFPVVVGDVERIGALGGAIYISGGLLCIEYNVSGYSIHSETLATVKHKCGIRISKIHGEGGNSFRWQKTITKKSL